MPHCAASVRRTMRRRSTASASAPPTNDMTRMGTSSLRLTRPTTSDEWLSAYAWNGTAT